MDRPSRGQTAEPEGGASPAGGGALERHRRLPGEDGPEGLGWRVGRAMEADAVRPVPRRAARHRHRAGQRGGQDGLRPGPGGGGSHRPPRPSPAAPPGRRGVEPLQRPPAAQCGRRHAAPLRVLHRQRATSGRPRRRALYDRRGRHHFGKRLPAGPDRPPGPPIVPDPERAGVFAGPRQRAAPLPESEHGV